MTLPTVIVTGANTGLGYEAAEELCSRGYDVVISVRDEEKGRKTESQIKRKVQDAKLTFIIMELSEPDSIRSFVNKFKATGKKLHILLNNAGVFRGFDDQTRYTARDDDSYEQTMTVNCMGTYLLTNLLLDELMATATESDPSRIVNITSGITTSFTNKDGDKPFDINDIMLSKPGIYNSGLHGYRNSKIAMNLWSNELAKMLKDTNIVVNTFCPGFIPSTNLARDKRATFGGRIFMWLMDTYIGRKMLDAEPLSVGRQRLVKAVVEQKYALTSGVYYEDGEKHEECEEVQNTDNQKKIWEVCTKFSGLKEDEMSAIVKQKL